MTNQPNKAKLKILRKKLHVTFKFLTKGFKNQNPTDLRRNERLQLFF